MKNKKKSRNNKKRQNNKNIQNSQNKNKVQSQNKPQNKNRTQNQISLQTKKDFLNIIKEALAGIITSFTACFMIFLYAPIEIFFTNVEEFNFAFSDIIATLLPVFFIAFILFSSIFIILRYINIKAYNISLVVFFIIYICTYIQGTYMSENLPPLDGRTIDWSLYSEQRIYSIILWVIISAILILIVKFKKWKGTDTFIKIVSILMSAQLFIVLIQIGAQSDGFSIKRDLEITADDIFEMSDDKNFIILLLDAVDSDALSKIMEYHPEYQEALSDFTYYQNMSCAYPFTKLSLPFIFSGNWFENERDFKEYDIESYKESPFFSLLQDNSYDMTLYEIDAPLEDEDILKFKNIKEKEYEITSKLDMTLMQMKLIGFKYAPFDLKSFCTVTNGDFHELKQAVDGTEIFSDNNVTFYNNIKEKDITLTSDKCFKYTHIEGAHVPYRYDKDVNVINGATYESNLEASMTITMEYLNKLKENDVYNNSVIIIMSDHGYGDGDVPEGRQNPIFFVKGFEESHNEMQISNAPVAQEDLQSAFAKLLDDKNGTDIFEWKEEDERERRFLFYVYHSAENYKHMTEYNITGHAADDSSLVPTGRIFDYKEE